MATNNAREPSSNNRNPEIQHPGDTITRVPGQIAQDQDGIESRERELRTSNGPRTVHVCGMPTDSDEKDVREKLRNCDILDVRSRPMRDDPDAASWFVDLGNDESIKRALELNGSEAGIKIRIASAHYSNSPRTLHERSQNMEEDRLDKPPCWSLGNTIDRHEERLQSADNPMSRDLTPLVTPQNVGASPEDAPMQNGQLPQDVALPNNLTAAQDHHQDPNQNLHSPYPGNSSQSHDSGPPGFTGRQLYDLEASRGYETDHNLSSDERLHISTTVIFMNLPFCEDREHVANNLRQHLEARRVRGIRKLFPVGKRCPACVVVFHEPGDCDRAFEIRLTPMVINSRIIRIYPLEVPSQVKVQNLSNYVVENIISEMQRAYGVHSLSVARQQSDLVIFRVEDSQYLVRMLNIDGRRLSNSSSAMVTYMLKAPFRLRDLSPLTDRFRDPAERRGKTKGRGYLGGTYRKRDLRSGSF